MDEIYYIVGMDARPWKRTNAVGTTTPLVLFFASVEALRGALNESSTISDFRKYFLLIVLAVVSVYLSYYFGKPWRVQYTKAMTLNLVYLGLISTGFFNVLFLIPSARDWLVIKQNNMRDSLPYDFMSNGLIAVIISAVGLIYIALQTFCADAPNAPD